MIDPTDLKPTYFKDDYDLEEFFIFCILVAGKTAKVVAKQLQNIKNDIRIQGFDDPLIEWLYGIEYDCGLVQYLKSFGIGCYTLKSAAIMTAIQKIYDGDLNLRTCAPQELESIKGIGPKTARFFIVYSRPDTEYAILDTHILKWLRERGYNAPKTTPTAGTQYNKWEKIFLSEMRKVAPGVKVQEFDLAIWNSKSTRSGKGIPHEQNI